MFPYYLSIGMSADQFWLDDPWLAKAYREMNDLNRQRRSEEMWLQGLYVFNAISTALSNLHFDGKHHKPNKYMEEPIRVTPLTEYEKEAKAEAERRKAIAYFDDLAKRWAKKQQ